MSEHEEEEVEVEGGSESEAVRSEAGAGADATWSGEPEGDGSGGEGEEGLDPVAALEAEVSKWKELALRSQADLENFRKRMTRERQEAMRYANGGLLETLLPILDNFQMGLEAARSESEDSMIFQGMNMVFNQINGFLEDQGVTEVETEGKAFDPKTHEAVAQEASDTVPEGEIIRVMRKGFRLRDRLLRAPAVVVSKGADGGVETVEEAVENNGDQG